MDKYTPITLDKTRNLRFNLKALKYIEETTGRSFLHQFALSSIADIAIVLYAGLRHEDKSLTLDQVEEMIDLDQINYVADRIQQAFLKSVPAKAVNKAETAEKKNQTGDNQDRPQQPGQNR